MPQAVQTPVKAIAIHQTLPKFFGCVLQCEKLKYAKRTNTNSQPLCDGSRRNCTLTIWILRSSN